MSEILKLQSWKTYNIYSVTPVKTKFGKTYILKDNNFNKYWANNKVTQYLNNRPNLHNTELSKKILFTIRTGDEKYFKDKDGYEVKFIETDIY